MIFDLYLFCSFSYVFHNLFSTYAILPCLFGVISLSGLQSRQRNIALTLYLPHHGDEGMTSLHYTFHNWIWSLLWRMFSSYHEIYPYQLNGKGMFSRCLVISYWGQSLPEKLDYPGIWNYLRTVHEVPEIHTILQFPLHDFIRTVAHTLQ